MMPRFTVLLSDDELKALKTAAASELRDFRDQARLIIKSELLKQGLLATDDGKNLEKQAASVESG